VARLPKNGDLTFPQASMLVKRHRLKVEFSQKVHEKEQSTNNAPNLPSVPPHPLSVFRTTLIHGVLSVVLTSCHPHSGVTSGAPTHQQSIEKQIPICPSEQSSLKKVPGLLEQGKLDRSLRLIRKTIRQCPKLSDSQAPQMAQLFWKLGSYHNAKLWAEKAISLPDLPSTTKAELSNQLVHYQKLEQQKDKDSEQRWQKLQEVDDLVVQEKWQPAWKKVETVRELPIWEADNLSFFAMVAAHVGRNKDRQELLDRARWTLEEKREPGNPNATLGFENYFQSSNSRSSRPKLVSHVGNVALIRTPHKTWNVFRKEPNGIWKSTHPDIDPVITCQGIEQYASLTRPLYCLSPGVVWKVDAKTGAFTKLFRLPFRTFLFQISKDESTIAYSFTKEDTSEITRSFLGLKNAKKILSEVEVTEQMPCKYGLNHNGSRFFLTPNASELVVFDTDHFTLKTWEKQAKLHSWVKAIAVHPKREEVVWICDSGQLCLSNTSTGKLLKKSSSFNGNRSTRTRHDESTFETNTWEIREFSYSDSGEWIVVKLLTGNPDPFELYDVLDAKTLLPIRKSIHRYSLRNVDGPLVTPIEKQLHKKFVEDLNLRDLDPKEGGSVVFSNQGLLILNSDGMWEQKPNQPATKLVPYHPKGLMYDEHFGLNAAQDAVWFSMGQTVGIFDLKEHQLRWQSKIQKGTTVLGWGQNEKEIVLTHLHSSIFTLNSDTGKPNVFHDISWASPLDLRTPSEINPRGTGLFQVGSKGGLVWVELSKLNSQRTTYPIHWQSSKSQALVGQHGFHRWSWSPDGSHFFILGRNLAMQARWDAKSHTIDHETFFSNPDAINSADWSENSRWLILFEKERMKLFDTTTNKIFDTIHFAFPTERPFLGVVSREKVHFPPRFPQQGFLWISTMEDTHFLYSLKHKEVVASVIFSKWEGHSWIAYKDGLVEPLGPNGTPPEFCPKHPGICTERYVVHGRFQRLMAGKDIDFESQ
jgi:hypothetical protein